MQKELVGKVLELFISKSGNKNRVIQSQIQLDSNGVLKDKFYGKNIQRSVLIASTSSYTLASENNIPLNYGQLGENILIDYTPYHLPVGSKIKIGNVLLEISQECTLCKSFATIEKNLPNILKKDRGIFAKVIIDGTISKNDSIYIF